MLKKIGTGFLWLIAIFMLSSVTIFNPGQETDFFVKLFNIQPSIPELKPIVITERDREIKRQADGVSKEDLRRTLEALTTNGSRVPGYPGHKKAFQFLKLEFEKLGFDRLEVEEYEVTVPVDQGAQIRVDETGETFAMYGLWPNHVQTPTLPQGGLSGPVVYGGKGSFKELSGKPIEGSIVLLDFNCGQNYFNPRMLGATAIIFFDNGRVTQGPPCSRGSSEILGRKGFCGGNISTCRTTVPGNINRQDDLGRGSRLEFDRDTRRCRWLYNRAGGAEVERPDCCSEFVLRCDLCCPRSCARSGERYRRDGSPRIRKSSEGEPA